MNKHNKEKVVFIEEGPTRVEISYLLLIGVEPI